MSKAIAVLSAACAALVAAGSVYATPVTTYTSAQINSATSVYVDLSPDSVTDLASGPVELSGAGTANYAYGNGSGGYTIKPTTDDVYAYASLTAGQLKARSSLSFGSNVFVSGAAMPLGQSNGSSSASAIFADHFSTYAGATPFLWTSGDQVTFQFAVTGTNTFTPGLPVPASYDPGQPKDLIYTSLQFTAYAPGGLDLLNQLQNFDFGTRSFDEYLAINSELESKILTNKIWFLGDSIVPFAIDPSQLLAVDGVTPAIASLSFNPTGDFDWLLRLDTTVQLDASLQNASAALDYSHTITTTYQPPAGATTFSSSGQFPGTLPLPEPGMMSLLGMAAMAMGRRRTR